MSTSEIYFNNLTIKHIYKTNIKHSYISVSKDGSITLKTPKVSDSFIQNLLSKKELWIRKNLQEVHNNPALKINLEDELILFGEIYSIDVEEAKELRLLLEKTKKTDEKSVIKCYDSFYKIYSIQYIITKVEYFANIMNLKYKEIKFRKMKSRWGSCSSQGVITFNTQLMKIDKELIEYIIVHELAHLTHMNHSKKFHDLVSEYISDAKKLHKKVKAINLLL